MPKLTQEQQMRRRGKNQAERETGIRQGRISACCRGKCRQAGGYKWRHS